MNFMNKTRKRGREGWSREKRFAGSYALKGAKVRAEKTKSQRRSAGLYEYISEREQLACDELSARRNELDEVEGLELPPGDPVPFAEMPPEKGEIEGNRWRARNIRA